MIGISSFTTVLSSWAQRDIKKPSCYSDTWKSTVGLFPGFLFRSENMSRLKYQSLKWSSAWDISDLLIKKWAFKWFKTKYCSFIGEQTWNVSSRRSLKRPTLWARHVFALKQKSREKSTVQNFGFLASFILKSFKLDRDLLFFWSINDFSKVPSIPTNFGRPQLIKLCVPLMLETILNK